MTYRPELAGRCEAAKIAPIVVPYLQGRCLDIGSGPGKVWPALIGIDIATQGGRPVTDMAIDGTKLPFADQSMDGIFSSFLLHQIDRSKVPGVLKEWWRALRDNGNFVLYLPHKDYCPAIDTDGADPAQKWGIVPDNIIDMMKDVGSWTMIENETRTSGDEYAFLQVFRKNG